MHCFRWRYRNAFRLACLGTLSFMMLSRLNAGDWPQWRGPGGQGISSETGLPAQWSTSENIAWKAKLAGVGSSSPIVWGDLVLVTSQIGDAPVRSGNSHPLLSRDNPALAGRETAIGGRRSQPAGGKSEIYLAVEAFHRKDGRRLWEYRVAASGELPENHEKHNMASPTPVTDGECIYTWFGNGQVLALDMQGKLVWKRHLGEEYGSFLNPWGHGSSPTLYADLLVLLCDHEPNAYLLALDKKTGSQRWKVDRGKDRVSHSTPFFVSAAGGYEMIVNSSRRIDAYNPVNGELLWYADSERQTPIPSPVSWHGMIYMSRGYRNSDYMAIQPGGRGDVTASHIKWRAPGAASYVPSILQYDGLLYMTNEVGVMTCAEIKNGEQVWRHRLDGIFFASPVGGDGKVYMLSETGEMFVMRAGRTPELLAKNSLEERFIASPAISGSRIFLRSDRTLFSIGR
jgi:outer membrane protein assembly factor BamB